MQARAVHLKEVTEVEVVLDLGLRDLRPSFETHLGMAYLTMGLRWSLIGELGRQE